MLWLAGGENGHDRTAAPFATIEDFLAFDDGTDRRYQLIRGAIVMMTPPLEVRGTIVSI